MKSSLNKMSHVNPIIFDKLKLKMSKNEVLDQVFLARIGRKLECSTGERGSQNITPIDLLLDHDLDKQKGVVKGNHPLLFPVSSQA